MYTFWSISYSFEIFFACQNFVGSFELHELACNLYSDNEKLAAFFLTSATTGRNVLQWKHSFLSIKSSLKHKLSLFAHLLKYKDLIPADEVSALEGRRTLLGDREAVLEDGIAGEIEERMDDDNYTDSEVLLCDGSICWKSSLFIIIIRKCPVPAHTSGTPQSPPPTKKATVDALICNTEEGCLHYSRNLGMHRIWYWFSRTSHYYS